MALRLGSNRNKERSALRHLGDEIHSLNFDFRVGIFPTLRKQLFAPFLLPRHCGSSRALQVVARIDRNFFTLAFRVVDDINGHYCTVQLILTVPAIRAVKELKAPTLLPHGNTLHFVRDSRPIGFVV